MTRRDPTRGRLETVVFGRHPVEAALASTGVEILSVAIARSRPPAERKALRRLAAERGVALEELSREGLTAWTNAARHDQGFAARVRLRRVMELGSFLDRLKGRAARAPVRVLGLDGVTNSQNVGMVVRSVVGAGLDAFLWPLAGQPWVNGLVVRAAAGAIFDCPIVLCDSLATGMAELQGAGFSAFGLAADAATSLFAETPPHRALFVLGSESEGLSKAVREQLDHVVSIPMAGPLESLNVAVAAGLVCFHAAGLLSAARSVQSDRSA
jgi:23S rRNA (guanosine2251-2'-O)-methyltransferase